MVRRTTIEIHTALAVCLLINWSTMAPRASGPTIRFEDITARAGINVRHHSRTYQGKNADVLRMFTSGGAAVAVGDYDNDGYEDLFITDSEKGQLNHLFHNNHDGTFTDVAQEAGVAGGNDPSDIFS